VPVRHRHEFAQREPIWLCCPQNANRAGYAAMGQFPSRGHAMGIVPEFPSQMSACRFQEGEQRPCKIGLEFTN